jgi:hypothetical protein
MLNSVCGSLFLNNWFYNREMYLYYYKRTTVQQQSMIDGPIVQIKQGTLRGAIQTNVDGENYLSFRGIPFAEPPVGILRFKVSTLINNKLNINLLSLFKYKL